MTILYLQSFIRQYKKLPPEIKQQARDREIIFRSDPFDQKLKTHKLSGKLESFWAFRINYSYRIVFEFKDQQTVWFHEIGDHDIYE